MNNYCDPMGSNWGWGNTSSQNYQNSFSHNGTSQDSSQSENNWNTPFIFKLQKKTNSKVITDDQDRRIISRESLFQDPNTFKFITSARVEINKQNKCQILKKNGNQYKNKASAQHSDLKYKPGFDWTKTSWQKASKACDTSPNRMIYEEFTPKMKKRKQSLAQKTTKAALAEPLKISKVENMMLKMGWKGGPLGKSGDGILEPIEPNDGYSCRLGFGQMEYVETNRKYQKQQKKPVMNLKSKGQKEIYKTNALNHILDFVRNDLEVEIKFDNKLRPIERKYVHHIVNEVINGAGEDEFDMDFDDSLQVDLLEEIKRCNVFVLGTQSEGKQSKRCLCLYKEAADHMFLITPEDLREDENENDKSNEVIDLVEEEDKEAEKETAAEGAAENKTVKSDDSKDNDMEVESKNLSVHNQDKHENNESNEVIDHIEEEEKEAEKEASAEKSAENEIDKCDESKNNDMEDESKNLSVQCQDENENDESNEVIDLIEEEEKEAAAEKSAVNETEKRDKSKDNDMELETKNLSVNNASNKSNNLEKSTNDVIEKFKKHCSLVENSMKINPEVLKRLVEYFIEFLQTQDYMEFRFLGAFHISEVNTINYFLSNYYELIDLLQDKEKVLEDLEKSGYCVQCMEDDNGSILFLKSVCTR